MSRGRRTAPAHQTPVAHLTVRDRRSVKWSGDFSL